MHLIKLSVGTQSVESLEVWQAARRAERGEDVNRHVTRMWPRRGDEVLNGGSIYWVIQGVVQCRQKIVSLDEVTGQDGIRRCAIVLEPGLVRTSPAPKRPFQGWRYLAPADAPADLPGRRGGEDSLPPELSAALSDIGVL